MENLFISTGLIMILASQTAISSAQEAAPLPAEPSQDTTQNQTQPTTYKQPTLTPQSPLPDEKKDESPFSWFTISPQVGLVVEMGFMFGATGIRGIPTGNLDYLKDDYPELADKNIEDLSEEDIPDGMSEADLQKVVEAKIAEALKFGTGFAFDLMIGLRFP